MAKQLSSGVAFLMRKHKIEVVDGAARLEKGGAAPKVVVVLKDGKSRALEAKAVILATGARARTIAPIGLEPDGERIWTYREAMVPKSAPSSLVVIGSGAIGIEFASFYGALGADVTVLEALDRILPAEDEEVSAAARKAFERRGLKFHVGATVSRLAKTKTGVSVAFEMDGEAQTLEADAAIVAVGIAGNVEDLGLEELGVTVERGHVVVDANGATNVRGLYAIGDVVGPPWLAHKASHEGVRCVEHIAGLAPDNLTAPIPGCTYSDPQIASVGLTEAQATAGGREVKVGSLSVPRQRQGHRRRRDRGVRQSGVRRKDRCADRRAHDRGRGHRDDPGVRPRHDPGSYRSGADRHRLPAPDHERGHARGGAGRLRTRPAHLSSSWPG